MGPLKRLVHPRLPMRVPVAALIELKLIKVRFVLGPLLEPTESFHSNCLAERTNGTLCQVENVSLLASVSAACVCSWLDAHRPHIAASMAIYGHWRAGFDSDFRPPFLVDAGITDRSGICGYRHLSMRPSANPVPYGWRCLPGLCCESFIICLSPLTEENPAPHNTNSFKTFERARRALRARWRMRIRLRLEAALPIELERRKFLADKMQVPDI